MSDKKFIAGQNTTGLFPGPVIPSKIWWSHLFFVKTALTMASKLIHWVAATDVNLFDEWDKKLFKSKNVWVKIWETKGFWWRDNFLIFFLSLENVKIRRHFAHRHLGLEFDKRLEEWVRLVEVNFELCHYRSKIILTLIGIVLSSCDCLIGSRGAGSVQLCTFELCFALDKLNQL